MKSVAEAEGNELLSADSEEALETLRWPNFYSQNDTTLSPPAAPPLESTSLDSTSVGLPEPEVAVDEAWLRRRPELAVLGLSSLPPSLTSLSLIFLSFSLYLSLPHTTWI